MLAVLQFPIADARPFDRTCEWLRAVPDWPNPATDINAQFIHNFGKAVDRRGSADPAWPDEMKFCLAKRAIRFTDLSEQHVGVPGARMHPKGAFRRLFCDQRRVRVRIEVGMTHHQDGPKLTGLDAQSVLAIVTHLCELPTAATQINADPVPNKLLRQGGALARLYALSTLNPQFRENAKQGLGLVSAGNPIVFVELKLNEAAIPLVPKGFLQIPQDKTGGALLCFGRLRTGAGVTGVWILQAGGAKKAIQRSLRLSLLRLHAEQEALDLVLKQINRGHLISPGTKEVVDQLDDYFNEATSLINRAAWGGIDQSAILAAFDATEQATPPATRQNLINAYDGARRQVWKKIENYQIRRATVRVVPVVNVSKGGTYVANSVTVNQSGVGNIANIAKYMTDVTNNVNNNLEKASASDEVKSLIKQLTSQFSAISSKADPKQTQRIGSDLQSLSSELTQPEPRRAWYELSLKGLKEAAQAIGEIANPIVETVGKLSLLLLH